jgi:hypothetical protein
VDVNPSWFNTLDDGNIIDTALPVRGPKTVKSRATSGLSKAVEAVQEPRPTKCSSVATLGRSSANASALADHRYDRAKSPCAPSQEDREPGPTNAGASGQRAGDVNKSSSSDLTVAIEYR